MTKSRGAPGCTRSRTRGPAPLFNCYLILSDIQCMKVRIQCMKVRISRSQIGIMCCQELILTDRKVSWVKIRETVTIMNRKYSRVFWSVASVDNELFCFDVWVYVCVCVCACLLVHPCVFLHLVLISVNFSLHFSVQLPINSIPTVCLCAAHVHSAFSVMNGVSHTSF